MLRFGVILAALFSLAIAISACGNDAPQAVTVVVTATPEPATSAPTPAPTLAPQLVTVVVTATP